MTLKIALVQSEQHWHDHSKNRQHFADLINDCEVDLIVLPEMFSTGFSMASEELAESMQGPTVQWMQEQASRLQTHVCGSLIIQDGDQYFNRFVLTQPDAAVSFYDKRHLFRMANEHQHYSAGRERLVFELKGFRICPQVCYDLRFPVYSRNKNDYDLLLYVANWPAARSHHWRSLLTARAIENQSFVVGVNRIGRDGNDVNYSGDSGLVDANGDWQVDLKDLDTVHQLEIELADLNQYRSNFPAWKDADNFTLGEH